MTLRSDYSGIFDPDLELQDFNREFLSSLMHEYNLIGHLLDRPAQRLVAMEYGKEGYMRSGIEEWQCASPIYSKRMQRLMKFEGNDVETVFKNLQLEVGAPQQFMDFNFRLDSPTYGEFWLPFCGALHDQEINNRGPEMIKAMCHDIEDPTFDATAAATHPNMVMRPVHRPPRIPESEGGNGRGRYPVCHWKVFITEEHQGYSDHPNLEVMKKTLIADVGLKVPEETVEPGGWDDYSGPFDPHCQFEDFSQKALVLLLQENALQTTMLSHSYVLSQLTHYGEEVARRFAEGQWVANATLAAARLQRLLDLPDNGIESVAKILQLHPSFQPKTYIDTHVEMLDDQRVRLSVRDCPALEENIPQTWFRQLGKENHRTLDATVAVVNPQARCTPVENPTNARYAWDVVIDPTAEPAKEPMELGMIKHSSGFNFKFTRRRLPTGIIARSSGI